MKLIGEGIIVAATKTLNLRVDAELKAQAEHIFSELGLSTSTAITMFLKSVVRYGGLPFEARLHTDVKNSSDSIEIAQCKSHYDEK